MRSRKAPATFVILVCLSVCISAVRTRQIYVKFYVRDFHEILSRNSNILLKLGANIGHFTWRLVSFIDSGYIKPPYKCSPPVEPYQALRIVEEV
jgi:hypothetical protein